MHCVSGTTLILLTLVLMLCARYVSLIHLSFVISQTYTTRRTQWKLLSQEQQECSAETVLNEHVLKAIMAEEASQELSREYSEQQ